MARKKFEPNTSDKWAADGVKFVPVDLSKIRLVNKPTPTGGKKKKGK